MNKLTIRLLAVLALAALAATTSFASATVGSGELTLEDEYGDPIPQDEHGMYEVYPGQTVYISIVGILEPYAWVQVRVSYGETGATVLGIFEVVGGMVGPIEWTVPGEAEICNTYVVQYRNALAPSSTHIAALPSITRLIPGHLHIVPEYPIGTLGAIAILFASFGIYQLTKSRRAVPASF